MLLIYNIYKFGNLFGIEIGNINILVCIEKQIVETAFSSVNYQFPVAVSDGNAVHARKFPIKIRVLLLHFAIL